MVSFPLLLSLDLGVKVMKLAHPWACESLNPRDIYKLIGEQTTNSEVGNHGPQLLEGATKTQPGQNSADPL